MTHTSETYLGDGLYVSWDGWQIQLRAPRENGDHWVGLEPNVFAALVEYQKRVTAPRYPVGEGMKRTQEIMEHMSSKPGDDQ